ncbi:MAG: HAD family hydrolase [Candidatus Latescibacterota bacterium]
MSGSPLAGIRLVVLDLDGTLLPSSKRLTDRARRVVGDLGAAGIAVSLATGKGWNLTDAYAAELGLETPQVALEGALVAHPGFHRDPGGTPLHRATLSVEELRRLAAAIHGLDLGFFFCTDHWRIRAHPCMAEHLQQVQIWDPVVEFAAAVLDGEAREAFVLHLVGRREPVTEARRRIEALGLAGAETIHWEFWKGLDQLQVRRAGTGKHTGVAHVLRALQLGPGEVLACGDWLNDVEMLRAARVAVAPADSAPEVRALAHHVLPETCEEDAVPRFLESALAGL